MIPYRIKAIRDLLDKYANTARVDPRVGHSVLIDPHQAVAVFREVLAIPNEYAIITPDQDELVRICGVPVRMRSGCPYGEAVIVKNADVPKPLCCEQAMAVMMVMCLTRGFA